MTENDIKNLISKALTARKNSYSPYSQFAVGSALLSNNGEIFCGCNIENSAFTPSVCAERVALFKAVSQGVKNFKAIAVVGGKNTPTDFCPPCGVCRQTLKEFCNDDFKVILAKDNLEYKIYTLSELLPHCFDKNNF